MFQWVPADWVAALDDVANELLERGRMQSPPVDCLALADCLRIHVAYDASQPGRARHKRIGGQSTVLVRPEERPERLQWAVAHELGEAFAWRVFERVDADVDEGSPQLREHVANLMASRLLLPSRWFFGDARRDCWDLARLKQRYSTASHELIAYRFLDVEEPTTVSLFDQGQLVRRTANIRSRAPRLTQVERDCWSQAHRENRSDERRSSSLIVQAWPVHEPGWKRELLRTTFAWHPDESQLPQEVALGSYD
ncbi:MAG: ImmA/IrrE family metallo-endopeptidase [Planctomycetaceae bacterium]|jgi:hypothetical protein|nr:ImmA/IrrE family metallo-endopeptidase [Planctomycetaceae bacterium]MBT6155955.1 ImmA/IrrE family metallo-endopeptidase [Planctomycetaceae bacterium]MBT6483130.1 ImmA/IrrE family metallo-endopeptidase [Planctomycetaceae bacterium]MBT6497732.1 ImmA/IrrE family metallo-endopeptidase [Planctomycetaceae bacterium]